ncbi:helix-turn-helix domain-containing protein [Vreelandella venusta]|uniref:HTH cro/C1-type domain-containing protein n=1 Tax=Vreelandella venusta TaxID=44935 RepID=A0ABX2BD93_9GAMM|nr:helix-turn-helix domain-containing protein [Halomonas venusta]AZM95856.1 helix-turn-helix domain-containing protein [Halomonas venusta]NPT30866.1 hypothetical protein [Halomonas venusta]
MEPMVHIDSRDDFSARLKEAIRQAGQDGHGMGARLARIARVTPKASSKWLNGESRPGHDKLVALCKWLNVREEWLEYGREPMRAGISSHDNGETQGHAKNLAILASPRSQQILNCIAEAAQDGRLTEDDLILLDQIANKLASTQIKQSNNPTARERLVEGVRDANKNTDGG